MKNAKALRVTISVAALLVASSLTVAGQERDSRMLRHEAMVAASLDEVWQAFTTKEGIESWMVPLAEVDFRLGGTLRTNYNRQAGLGGPGTITHRILSYEPKRMFSTRYTAPENAPPYIKLSEATWTVIRFEPLADHRTRVTVSHLGFGHGADWDQAYQFFEKGNAWTLEQLKRRFARGEKVQDADRVLQLLRSITGGEWIFENTRADGSVFRGRTRLREIMDGKFVLAEGWLGSAGGMWPHVHMLYGRDPDSGEVWFWDFGEGGALARGRVWLAGDNRLAHDWNMIAADGSKRTYYVELAVEAPQAMRMLMYRDAATAAAAERPIINVLYRRVAEVPEPFTVLRKQAVGGEK